MIESFINIALLLSSFFHPLSVSFTQALFCLSFPLVIYKGFKSKISFTSIPLLKPLILLVLWIVLADLLGDRKASRIKDILSWWHFLFFYLSYLSIRLGLINLDKILALALGGALIQSFYGIGQIFILHWARAKGFFHNALTYSNILLLTLTVTISIMVKSKGLNKKFIAGTTFILTAGLLCGLSRWPVYSFILFLFVLFLLKYKFKGMVVCLITIAVAIALTYNTKTFERLYGKGYSIPISNSARIELWETSIDIIKDHPIFGIGVGGFPKIVDHYNKNIPTESKGHVHNGYLQLAINYGIPSLFIVMMIYGGLLKKYLSCRSHPMALASISLLIMYLIQAITEDVFGDSEIVMYFWFLQGALVGTMDLEKGHLS